MKSIIYVGMDVHKITYNLCAINGQSGEIIAQTKCNADIDSVLKFIDNVKKKSGIAADDLQIVTGYEAGCLGFSLYHELAFNNIECVILAPSTMQGSVKNKMVKNDRMDAANIATNLMCGTYKAVHVPTEHDNEIKEYIGMREDVLLARKRIKQQISALVLRRGLRYSGKSQFTAAHIKWLETIELPDVIREVLNEYLKVYDYLTGRIEIYNKRITEFSQEEDYQEHVSDLSCLKGVTTLSAMKIKVSIGDFTRFPTAKAFMANLGMLPGESSSGEKHNNTPITKMGNSMVRKTLVECAQALVKGTPGKKSKALKSRQKGRSDEIVAYADRAVERLQKRFKRMRAKNKPYNVAVMAIARELAGFIWGIETGNIKDRTQTVV